VVEKKITDHWHLMNYENWLTMNILHFQCGDSANYWVYPNQRFTTSQYQLIRRRCGSWLGSMPGTLKTPQQAAVAWSTTLLAKALKLGVTVCDTSCAAWVYGRFIRNPGPQFPAIQLNDFSALLSWIRSARRMRSGRQTLRTFHFEGDFSTWWLSSIFTPDTSSAGSYRTALTRSSAWTPWRRRWRAVIGRESSIPTKVANSPPLFLSRGFKRPRSRSAGRAEGDALTTSWLNASGGRSSTKRCTSGPMRMAGKQRLAWPGSSGGTAM